MKLANLMDPRLILLGADVDSLDAAMESAMRAIKALYPHEISGDEALAKLRERQLLGGTCFPTGVAVPHARLPELEDFIIAAVVPKKPLIEDSAPPVRVVYVVLLSQTRSSIYLNTLAKLLEASQSEAIMSRLVAAAAPQDFIEVFAELGYEVKKDLAVTDIMTKEIVSVRENATLKELTDVLYSRKLHYVPVLDEAGSLVGELGVLDLIKAGIPDYAFRIGSLKFLAELEPMTELLKNEERILVESIMQKPKPIPPKTSVVELAFEMARGKKRHYTIVADGKPIGVVSYMDILYKVLRA